MKSRLLFVFLTIVVLGAIVFCFLAAAPAQASTVAVVGPKYPIIGHAYNPVGYAPAHINYAYKLSYNYAKKAFRVCNYENGQCWYFKNWDSTGLRADKICRFSHVVRKGQPIEGIAAWYGRSSEIVRRVNNLPVSQPAVGRQLCIPLPTR